MVRSESEPGRRTVALRRSENGATASVVHTTIWTTRTDICGGLEDIRSEVSPVAQHRETPDLFTVCNDPQTELNLQIQALNPSMKLKRFQLWRCIER